LVNRLISISILFTLSLLSIQIHAKPVNYADREVRQSLAKIEKLDVAAKPLQALLLAEDLYFLAHETQLQEEILRGLTMLFDRATHQELRMEIGYFRMQHARQLGYYDQVGEWVKSLGFAPKWRTLGPIAPQVDPNPFSLMEQSTVKGPTRDVMWQDLAAYGEDDHWTIGLGHYGFFAANQAIYPNQNMAAVLTTWFYAPDKGVYRLGLGWTQRMAVWVNQVKVFDENEKQSPHPDQETVHMRLKRGWHKLTVYRDSTGTEKPELGFFLRLTDEAGKAPEFNVSHDGRLPRRKPKIRDNQETSLVALASAAGPYKLASTLMIKEQFNTDAGNVDELLGRAFNEDPNRSVTEKALSMTEDPNEEWRYLTAFLDAAPQDEAHALDRAWAYYSFARIALNQNRFWEARHYVRQALEAYPEYWPANLIENNVLSSLELDGAALRNTLDVAKNFPGVPWIMMDIADLYDALNFNREADQWTTDILEIRHASRKFQERRIETLQARGDTEALNTLYEQVLRDGPYALSTVFGYANFLTANRDYDRAEELLSSYLEFLPNNPDLLEAMGELKLLRDDSEALTYLEMALALNPQNPDLENLINLSRNEEAAFYKPYIIEEPADVQPAEITNVVINFENTVRKVAQNGTSSSFHQMEWEIVDDLNPNELPGYSFSYAPLRQKAELLKAEIYRGDRTILLTDYGRARMSDPQYRMYYDLVAFQIPFPTLEKGDRIRVEYRIDDTERNNIFGDYFGDLLYFTSSFPIKTMAYTLIFPKGRQLYYHVDKMDPKFEKIEGEEDTVYRWVQDRISPYESEPRMPGLAEFLPYVSVSTFNSWEEMASWYATLIRGQLDLDHDTKKIVAKLVEGITDRKEIVKRIHEYVVTQTRYVALEFGIHGYKPYQVNQVNTRQFGDCKDKASLIIAMLEEAGIDAEIAIVRTSDKGQIHTYPASLGYFNHAIAYIPEFDLYLDGTAEFSGLYELPSMDQGGLTLLVDQDGSGRLTTIPVYDDNLTDYEFELRLKPDKGYAELSGEVFFKGLETPSLRQYLSIDAQLEENLEDLLGGVLPGLEVETSSREGTALNDPIRLTFNGKSKQLYQRGEGEIQLPLSLLNDYLVRRFAATANRRFPLEMGPPNKEVVSIGIEVPAGFELAEIPDNLEMADENFGVSIKFTKASPDRLDISYELDFKSNRIEPDAYPSLRRIMQAHDRIIDQSLQLVESSSN
jgi:tetratricopeptide (TPR) repeat protein